MQYSLFGSILTIGAMVGAILSGRIADLIGRRCAMAVSDFLCIIGWISIFLTKDIMWLDLGRLSVGCGIGLLSYVIIFTNSKQVPVYIAEITPKNLRGGFAAVNQVKERCWIYKIIFMFSDHFLGVLSITQINWRFFFSGTFPCFLQLLSLFFIPESPRWLVSHLDLCHDFEVLSAMVGKDNEFEVVLKRLRGEHSDVSQEAEEILVLYLSSNKFSTQLHTNLYVHGIVLAGYGWNTMGHHVRGKSSELKKNLDKIMF
ncbi:hypothetical protein GW17_00000520 [Ensete ventricosum]|nr:hypothetical protein GW17_00000520 [Ensete ventricosum]